MSSKSDPKWNRDMVANLKALSLATPGSAEADAIMQEGRALLAIGEPHKDPLSVAHFKRERDLSGKVYRRGMI